MAYFRAKGYRTSDSWLDVWQEEHARAFIIVRLAQEDLLAETRGFIDRALAEGIPTDRVARDLEEHLRGTGWWGKGKHIGPDGVEREDLLGTPYRVRTILRTNINTAYAAGRYRRAKRDGRASRCWTARRAWAASRRIRAGPTNPARLAGRSKHDGEVVPNEDGLVVDVGGGPGGYFIFIGR